MAFRVRPTVAADADWVEAFVRERWGAAQVVVSGRTWRPRELSGFVAEDGGGGGEGAAGLATYVVEAGACHLVTLDATTPRRGIGSALLAAVERRAREEGCVRVWLVTTNDNVDALRFYQRRGYVLAALRRNELERARAIKPEIAQVGLYGIPLRDELECEKSLGNNAGGRPGDSSPGTGGRA
jgi:DNA-3-methyladenine glycosylase I